MRKLITFSLSIFFSIALFSQVDLENGLVAYFPFTGNAEDASTFENDALRVFDVTLSEGFKGNADNAYYFDGDNDFIEIPHQPQLGFGDQTDAFSISIWVRPDAIQSDSSGTVNDFLGKWNSLASEQGYDFGMRYYNQTSDDDEGKISFVRYDGPASNGCGNAVSFLSTDGVNDGEWHHIVVTRSTSGLIEMFLDGQSQGTIQDDGECTIDNMENITLGVRTLNLSISERRSYQGNLDEFRIYNRVINSDEVQALFDQRLSSTYNPISDQLLFVSPNPITGNTFQLLGIDQQQVAQIEVLSVLGTRKAILFNNNISTLDAGTYFFFVTLKNGDIHRAKVLVQ